MRLVPSTSTWNGSDIEGFGHLVNDDPPLLAQAPPAFALAGNELVYPAELASKAGAPAWLAL